MNKEPDDEFKITRTNIKMYVLGLLMLYGLFRLITGS